MKFWNSSMWIWLRIILVWDHVACQLAPIIAFLSYWLFSSTTRSENVHDLPPKKGPIVFVPFSSPRSFGIDSYISMYMCILLSSLILSLMFNILSLLMTMNRCTFGCHDNLSECIKKLRNIIVKECVITSFRRWRLFFFTHKNILHWYWQKVAKGNIQNSPLSQRILQHI